MSAKEKLAIIATTKHGVILAEKLYRSLDKCDIYIPNRFQKEIKARSGKVAFYTESTKSQVEKALGAYYTVVFIDSLSAAVHTIAPFVKDRHPDPAILVVDDTARFVIVVFPGYHLDQDHAQAEKISKLLGARLVTTATPEKEITVVGTAQYVQVADD